MTRKEQAFQLLESMKEEIFELGDRLFSAPELGFKEEETARLISSYLTEKGILHEKGLTLTGLRARLGDQGYHIGLLADMDALPVQGEEGPLTMHACGHSIQITVMLAVLAVLKKMALIEELPGRISFMAAPAEEYVDLDFRRDLIRAGKIRFPSGKQNMIADGSFDDVDCVLSCHISGSESFRFDVGSSLAGFSAKKVIFEGRAAHSGVAPHEGINALHAATLCLQAAAFLTQQFPQEAGIRLYPILTEGGVSMNAIPERAVLETYLRANKTEDLFLLQDKFEKAARHSALALGASCRIEHTIGYLPLKQSDALNEIVYRNMLTLSEEDMIEKNPVSGASGDIGDVAAILPAVQFGFSGTKGRVHSRDFEIADPHRTYMDPAKVLLGTLIDLLENPECQVTNPNYPQDKAAYLENWLLQD